MEDIVKEPEVAPVAPTKKRGWPKGKPRKPRAVVGEMMGSTAVIDNITAPDAPPKRRRRRRNVSGVKVGKQFYPGVMAVWQGGGRFLCVKREGAETWIPVDGEAALEVKGFALPPLSPNGGTTWYSPGTTYTYTANNVATNQAAATGSTGPRLVEPQDYVNIAPERQAYVERNAKARNSELESLTRMPFSVPQE